MGLATNGSILDAQTGGGVSGPTGAAMGAALPGNLGGGATMVPAVTGATPQPSGGSTFLQGIGGGLVSNLVGAGMGLLLQGEQNRNQLSQQNKLDAMQLGYNEQAANYSQQLQYKTWLETNYPEQVQQLKEAGLNPDLMYSKGGPGGTTGSASASGVNSGTPGAGSGGAVTQAMGIQLQGQLMQAQIQNIQAQTNKTKAETPDDGTNTADVQNANVQQNTKLQKLQSTAQGIQNTIQDATTLDQIRITDLQAQQLQQNVNLLKNDVSVSDATVQTKINQQFQDLEETVARKNLELKNISWTQQQITNSVQALQQNYEQITTNEQNANTASAYQHYLEQINDVPESNRLPQQAVQDIFQLFTIKGILGGGNNRPSPIQGFGGR